ncbi:hypothetical protein COY25_04735 [Candidatus Uhrbacteria bacterium CG_4_10_14_0_2_um_filter_41_7]|uniref:Uncharacterized protein n=1 Tax=Candidatus Uhrbacteria bacterium CG_4_9_14_3_um_filter_41_35 TaxID=1975034 RepID=A0A2M7XE20_9BACT|nr:MAG: hypothetical protein COV92_02040 [Candidatus Uhrbacteria bacterium CG11_big_fil_rev_8_21_14_0_20_41_9]PIZ52629.1 MAG: hypothetical protein COY25_04735 [Candidatus Uhrbacteria bacterium CG_4_10_14_0_2_um_filter_41_7]PJA46119.1 MAG: hypothetical protein CO173_03710 [Candidatus Uhrbacteria bacterium CG_4_9_14_3_um_filter_41_35]
MTVKPIENTLEVSATGEWEVNVTETLQNGAHALVVTDEFGNEDNAFLYVQGSVKTETLTVAGESPATVVYQVETLKEIFPPIFAWVGLILLILILSALTVNYLVLKRVSKNRKRKAEKKVSREIRFLRWASIILFVLLATFGIIFLLDKRILPAFNSTLQNSIFSSGQVAKQSSEPISKSGTVRDPYTLEPISGIELTSKEVTIITGESGYFSFSDVDVEQGIRIYNANLQKNITLLPSANPVEDIFFSIDLMNLLIKITNAEAQGDSNLLLPYFEKDVRDVLNKDKVVNTLPDIFDSTDVMAQTLYIYPIERIGEQVSISANRHYEDVVRVIVQNKNKSGSYNFVFLDGRWWLID